MVLETDTSVHPPSSLAAFCARDFRDGLHRLARFKSLCTPEKLNVIEKNGKCEISIDWNFADEQPPDVLVDADFAVIVELGRRGTGVAMNPLKVELTRSRPENNIHKDYFKCPIIFGSQRNLLVFASVDIARPFPGHNPELLEMLTPALSSALEEINLSNSITEQVKIALKRSLASGRPELSNIAKDMGMSERTLQRRITAANTTFRDLIVEARQELGRKMLLETYADMDEISCLLGYQDTSSFYRAFRDWEGVTPNIWKKLNA